MPTIRKLTPEEVQAAKDKAKGPRQLLAEEYDRYMVDVMPGDYIEVELGDNESRLTIASRLKAAAKRQNLALRAIRSTDPFLRFRVTAQEEEAAQVPPEDEEAPVGSDAPPGTSVTQGGRKRGRKKKEA